jgi:hypothetical protein
MTERATPKTKAPRGGKRLGSGRRKGVPNKATAEVKDICRQHALRVITELVRLATEADTSAARIAACKEVLDRAYGKAPQAIVGDSDNPTRLAGQIELIVVDPKN